jgi:hypothetical protein
MNISFSVDGYAASAAGGDPTSAVQVANDVVDFYDAYTGGPSRERLTWEPFG